MCVFQVAKIWPGETVPILKEPLTSRTGLRAAEWINKCTGLGIFRIVTGTPPTNYIRLCDGGGSSGGDGDNGFKASIANRQVSAGKLRSFLHELMHVLGFEHEQLNKNYLWVAESDLKETKRSRFNKAVGRVISGVWGLRDGASQNLKSWWNMRTKGVHSDVIDLDSVMMYPAFRQVVTDKKKELGDAVARGPGSEGIARRFLLLDKLMKCKKTGASMLLSDMDIASIQAGYSGAPAYEEGKVYARDVDWDAELLKFKDWNTKTIQPSALESLMARTSRFTSTYKEF